MKSDPIDLLCTLIFAGFAIACAIWVSGCKHSGLGEVPPPMQHGDCRITGFVGMTPSDQDCLYQGVIWQCKTEEHGMSFKAHCAAQAHGQPNDQLAEAQR